MRAMSKRRLYQAVLFVAVVLSPLPGLAQTAAIPLLNALTSKSGSSSPANVVKPPQTQEQILAALDTQQQEMQKRLDEIKAEIVKSQNALTELASTDVAARDVAMERMTALQLQQDSTSQILDGLKDLRRLNVKILAAQQEKDAWQPPSGSSPWPLAAGDELQFAMMQLKYQIQHQDQRLGVLDEGIVDLKKRRSKLEIDFRQAGTKTEAATAGRPQGVKSTEVIKRQLDQVNLDLTSAAVEKDIVTAQRRAASIELSKLKLTWDYYDSKFVFTEQNLSKVLTEIEGRIEKLRKQEQLASVRINRTLDQATAAKSRLDALEKTPNTPVDALTAARRALRATDMQAAAARIEREKFSAVIDLESLSLQIWKLRGDIYSNNDVVDQLTRLKLKQEELRKRLDQGRQYLTQMIAEKSLAAYEISEQIQNAKDAAEKAFLTDLLKPINEQLDSARSVFAVVDRVRQLLEVTGEELVGRERRLSWSEKLEATSVTTTAAMKSVWNYEIFAVDDSILVDGREIKTKRSITIGKSVGALAILVIGFMLISNLIRRTLAFAVDKAHLTTSKSVILGRWLSLLLGVTLIITAFNLVEIPLSAFAFFGGALAIGVGFGTQNLLKNLISGVMLLIEKPIRIGDLVEIDGITGVVTSIGIRFSTIHGAQGTDTLIPNSVLVEHNLINWTYSTPNVRKDIKVSVSYSTNVEQVREILFNVTQSHPLVMRTPEPLITLDDFGDNGLLFNTQFWLEIKAGVNSNRVMSDLRFMILKAFTDAGIDLPFPQRVLQFKEGTSMPVRIADSES